MSFEPGLWPMANSPSPTFTQSISSTACILLCLPFTLPISEPNCLLSLPCFWISICSSRSRLSEMDKASWMLLVIGFSSHFSVCISKSFVLFTFKKVRYDFNKCGQLPYLTSTVLLHVEIGQQMLKQMYTFQLMRFEMFSAVASCPC